jgi:hypothetical protein
MKKRILLIAASLAALASVSCSLETPPAWSGTPNPLDEPGEQRAAAEALHAENVAAITQHGFRGFY